MTQTISRRTAMQTIAACSLALCAADSKAISSKLQSTDPEAQKLGYVDNAAKVDAKRYPSFKQGQTCANCQLVQMRYGPMRPCTLFPGKMVAATGWCSGWSKKTNGN